MKELFYEIEGTTPWIELYVYFSEKGRREGLLSIEEDITAMEDTGPLARLTRLGLQLVVDGADPELVRNILDTRVDTMRKSLNYRWLVWKSFLLKYREESKVGAPPLFTNHPENPAILAAIQKIAEYIVPGSDQALQENPHLKNSLVHSCLQIFYSPKFPEDLLDGFYQTYCDLFFTSVSIVIDGILSIQSGDNPRIVKDKLFGYTGDLEREKLINQEAGQPDGNLSPEEIEALLNIGKAQSETLQAFSFSHILTQMDERAIETVIRQANPQDLALALINTTEDIKNLILTNMSRQASAILKEDMHDLGAPSLKDIESAQRNMADLIRKLQEDGYITLDK